jgi:hypothetical protein
MSDYEIMSYPKQEYRTYSGICSVPDCKNHVNLFTCVRCGTYTCGSHHIFTGKHIRVCYWCNGWEVMGVDFY